MPISAWGLGDDTPSLQSHHNNTRIGREAPHPASGAVLCVGAFAKFCLHPAVDASACTSSPASPSLCAVLRWQLRLRHVVMSFHRCACLDASLMSHLSPQPHRVVLRGSRTRVSSRLHGESAQRQAVSWVRELATNPAVAVSRSQCSNVAERQHQRPAGRARGMHRCARAGERLPFAASALSLSPKIQGDHLHRNPPLGAEHR
jgi:hypothetical protein